MNVLFCDTFCMKDTVTQIANVIVNWLAHLFIA